MPVVTVVRVMVVEVVVLVIKANPKPWNNFEVTPNTSCGWIEWVVMQCCADVPKENLPLKTAGW